MGKTEGRNRDIGAGKKAVSAAVIYSLLIVLCLSGNCWAMACEDGDCGMHGHENQVIPALPSNSPWVPVSAAVPPQDAEAAAENAAAAVTTAAQTAAYNDTMSQWQQYIDKETDPAKKAQIAAQAKAAAENASNEVGNKMWAASKNAFKNYYEKNPQAISEKTGEKVAAGAVKYASFMGNNAAAGTLAQWESAIKASGYNPQVISQAQAAAKKSYSDAFNKSMIQYLNNLNNTFFGKG